MKTFNGYKKKNLTDSNLLLAGSGHKPLNELLTDLSRPASTNKISITVGGNTLQLDLGARAWDSTTYLPLSGGTVTGPIEISTGATNNSYNEGLRLTRANNSWAGITFGSTGLSGAPTGGWFVATNPSNQFIINPDDSGNTGGLCLNKDGDLKWRNQTVIHSGNISSQTVANATNCLKNYGASTARPNGNSFTLPGGANAVQMRSGATSGNDIGIFHLSDDNCFICNSSDDNYTFAVFDTDKTADFSNAANSSFAVLSDKGGCTVNGNLIIHAGNIGSQSVNYANSAGNADTVDSLHGSNLVKFFLSPMTSGAPADSAKSWFTGTMPSASGAIVYNVPGVEKTIIAGKSSGAHGHMLQLNYDDTYLRILRYYGGNWKSTDWEKISAGYADSAGSIAWDNITGKPTIVTNPYTGHVQITGRVFGYNYGNQGSNAAAFMWDKPGLNYTGIGAHGVDDEIYFCACSSDGSWVTNYYQKWYFNGDVIANGDIKLKTTGRIYQDNTTPVTLYIGRSDNAGWVCTQDICSQNGTGDTYWSLRVDGTAHFVNAYSSSDFRLKKNLKYISKEEVDSFFNTLYGYLTSFEWKNNSKKSFGTISLWLKDFCPESIDEKSDGFLSVNYNAFLSKVSACLFIKLKENIKETSLLKDKIKELETKIKILENGKNFN